jgi:hypothetical protein
MLSVERAVTKFKEIINAASSWASLKDSQFAEHVATFVSWCLRDAQFKTERAKQEMFISTALNRASLVAHAEDRDYIPRKPTPASGTITIHNKGTAKVSLPVGVEFDTDDQFSVTTLSAAVIEAGASATIAASQYRKTELTFPVETEEIFHEIRLSRELTPRVASFSVDVNEDDGAGYRVWNYARLLQNTYPSSRVYDEFYAHTDQIGIRFGNGNFGRIVPEGAIVRVRVDETHGGVFLSAGQQLYPVREYDDYSGQPAVIEAVIATAFSGGLDVEGTEETRRNLHYWPTYNGELVWAEDYVYFLERRYPGILFARAWGEQEAEEMAGSPSFDFINKIFICAYAEGHPTLQSDCMTALQGVELLNRTFEWVEPVHVSFTVEVTGKVLQDVVLSEAEAAIRDVLEKYYGKNSSDRRKTVYLSEIYDAIQETGYFSSATGARFEVTLGGQWTQNYLYEVVSVDLDGSTFDLSYM